MKVYIVVAGERMEGSRIEGVYASKEHAVAKMEAEVDLHKSYNESIRAEYPRPHWYVERVWTRFQDCYVDSEDKESFVDYIRIDTHEVE